MFLLDTNICIYLIRQHPVTVVEKIKTYEPYQLKISSITVAELEFGAYKSDFVEQNRKVLLKFLSAFDIVSFDDLDAEYFGKIKWYLQKNGRVIGPYDLQIAAQALCKGFTVVTNNEKEFRRVPNLQVMNWV